MERNKKWRSWTCACLCVSQRGYVHACLRARTDNNNRDNQEARESSCSTRRFGVVVWGGMKEANENWKRTKEDFAVDDGDDDYRLENRNRGMSNWKKYENIVGLNIIIYIYIRKKKLLIIMFVYFIIMMYFVSFLLRVSLKSWKRLSKVQIRNEIWSVDYYIKTRWSSMKQWHAWLTNIKTKLKNVVMKEKNKRQSWTTI